MKLKNYLHFLRVNNYIKNVFIFFPFFFVLKFEKDLVLDTLNSFLFFCLLTSGIYILNDIFDIESDKLHPVKRNRPLAAGLISIKRGKQISLLLILISFIGIGLLNKASILYFSAYLSINLLYNFYLKKVAIVDVMVLGLGFVIRILVGSSVSDIPPSSWILAMTFLLSIFLGFSKRRADLLLPNQKANQRLNLKSYTEKGLNYLLVIISIIISVSYVFYTISDEVKQRWGSNYVFLTSVWVILGISRYLNVIFTKKEYYTPTSMISKDRILQLIVISWILTFFLIYWL